MPYKVLVKEKRKLVSVVAIGKSKVNYKTNKWVQAPKWLRLKGYHLLYFNKLKSALNFAKVENNVNGIYYCKVQNKIKKMPEFADIWELGEGIFYKYSFFGWAIGTRMAKKIMITGKVKIK